MTLIERLLAQANKEANELADLLNEAAQALAQPQQEPWCMKINGCKTKCEDCPDKALPNQRFPVQWHLSKNGLPPVGSEVIGGHFYRDTWLKGDPEVFAWGLCRVFKDDNKEFPDGKRWQTFGPSHNQITHWCWPPQPPGDTPTSPLASTATSEDVRLARKPLTEEEINYLGYGVSPLTRKSFARAIEAAHGIKKINE
jgi:hypothetical protein